MNITSPFQYRSVQLLLVAVLLVAGLPARAQTDPQANVRILVLENRVDLELKTLQNRMNKAEEAVVEVREESRAERAKDRLEIEILKQDAMLLRAQVQQLSDAVDALKAQRPVDPAKPPAPGETPDPAKPAEGQVLSLRAPFIVKDAAGRVIFKVDVAGGSQPRAIVGNPAGGRVEIGIGAGGASVVGLYDDSGKILSTLVGDPNGSYLRLRDNDQSAALGKVEGTGTGLYLRKAEKSFAELVVGKTGHGVLKVFNADGKAVSGMFASAEGGGVSLTGPTGGKSALDLSVTASGGKVRVFPAAGGSARAELIADGNVGALNIFGSAGANAVTVASVESKAGKIEITNSSGNIVVQAGQQANGRGMVTTGPFEGGLAGTLGGGLTPASTIVGQMKGK